MDQKTLSLKILWLAEVIISIRVLLFSIPVSVSRLRTENPPPISNDDRFIFLLMMAALLYLVIGVASLMGHKLWRFFHYLGAVTVGILTTNFIITLNTFKASIEPVYFLPVFISFAGFCYVLFTKASVKDSQ